MHLGVQEDFVPSSRAHPAFTVADVDALAERLRQAGCEVEPDTALPERKRFYTFDPFGGRIEFIQHGFGFSQWNGHAEPQPRLYTDLAEWWPLFSPPEDYAEEAADLLQYVQSATDEPPRTLLELGCGGGSLAFHLKQSLQLTLTDLSPQMLRQPEGESRLRAPCGGHALASPWTGVRSRSHPRRHHVRDR